MKLKQNLNQIEIQMKHLEKSGYDVEKYMESLKHQIGQLEYFYCFIAKNGNPDHYYYHLNSRPQEHQMAYFNIGRGYPKELMDGHFCYIVKDFGYKALIIPTTSIKKNSLPCHDLFEKDIDVLMDGIKTKSRLQLSDMRVVDMQRLDERKKFVKVCTQRQEIIDFVLQSIFS